MSPGTEDPHQLPEAGEGGGGSSPGACGGSVALRPLDFKLLVSRTVRECDSVVNQSVCALLWPPEDTDAGTYDSSKDGADAEDSALPGTFSLPPQTRRPPCSPAPGP